MGPGDTIRIEVEKCVFGGDGLARVDGQVVFVPGVLPGEVLLAEITACRKNFLRGRALRRGTDSPYRREPGCPAAGRCPGCVYRHAEYGYETELKQQQLLDFLEGAGISPEEPVMPPVAPLPADGYRNKLVLHVHKEGGETRIGYIGADQQSVTPIETCPLVRDEINAELRRCLADPGFRHSVHHRMSLTFRHTIRDGVKFWRNQAPRNATWLREDTSVGTLSVPWDGFFQVNAGGTEALISEMRRLIDQVRPERVLDLYCGVGLFSAVAAACGVPAVTGVELAAEAVAAARYNLKQLGRPDADFRAGDAAVLLTEVAPAAGKRTLAVVDPPRTGLSPVLLKALNDGKMEHLAYVSCHPATWVRDAGRLTRRGWRLIRVGLINQFARTAHFEVFSYFSRG